MRIYSLAFISTIVMCVFLFGQNTAGLQAQDVEEPLLQSNEYYLNALLDIEQKKSYVLDRLADDSIWHSYSGEAALLLRLVRSMRMAEAAPLLVKHLDYRDHGMTVAIGDSARPVVWTLISIGTPAIPSLLDLIQSPIEEIIPNEFERMVRPSKRALNSRAILTIKRICEPLGNEDELVAALIRSRMEEVDEEKRAQLAEALQQLEESALE